MRVCHVTFGFPPTIGGTETHNYSLVRYLLKKGYDVHVVVLRAPSVSKDEINKTAHTVNRGIKVHDIFPKRFPFWIFQIRNKIKEMEKEGKIDVIDAHSMFFVLPFLFQKRKVLLSLHFLELNCARLTSFPRPCTYSFKKCWRCCGVRMYLEWRIIRWLAVRKPIKFMVKYEHLKNLLVNSGIKKENIAVVPHWIDIELINKKAKSVGASIESIKSSDYVFAFFGRLAEEKGPDILLEAFAHLAKKKQNVKLMIIGDGPLRRDLEESCGKLNLKDKVIFLDAIPHENLFGYLSVTDTIVLPHRYFNYEWALLEAMCTDKPIIATNMVATTDILIDGYNALLALPNPKSLSSKMQEMLETPELGKKLAKNALETVKRKHSLKNLEYYEKLIKGLLR